MIVLHHLSQAINATGPIKIMGYIGFILVGLFFFLSGYGLKYGLDHKENYLDGFLKKKVLAILVPFELINIACLLFRTITGMEIDVIQTLLSFAGWDYLSDLWFITSILILYVLFYISFSISKNNGNIILVALILIYIFICYFCGLHSYWTASVFAFVLGTMFGKETKKFETWIRNKYFIKTATISIVFIGLFFGRLALSLKGVSFEYLHIPLRNIITVTFVMWVLMIFQKIKIKNSNWATVGLYSLEIYMVHFVLIKYMVIANLEFKVIFIVLISLVGTVILNLLSKTLKNCM